MTCPRCGGTDEKSRLPVAAGQMVPDRLHRRPVAADRSPQIHEQYKNPAREARDLPVVWSRVERITPSDALAVAVDACQASPVSWPARSPLQIAPTA